MEENIHASKPAEPKEDYYLKIKYNIFEKKEAEGVGEILMLYQTLKWLVRCFLCVYHRISISGMEHIPEKGAFILAGNHVSYLDPFYVAAMLERKVHFMAKAEAFKPVLFRWFLHFAGAFPVHRGKADLTSMKIALSHLKNGRAVGIFPEGTIKGDNSFEELKRGAAYLAVRIGCPVIPFFIEGVEKALPSGSFWIRPVRVSIRIGKPIRPVETGKSKDRQAHFSYQIQQAFLSLKKQGPCEEPSG